MARQAKGDAGEFIAKLKKAEHTATEWQTAMGALLLTARGARRRCHASAL